MQNVHGKEIDLLRTTVKVPGKRLPRATTTTAPSASPKTNGLAKERSSMQFAGGTGKEVDGSRPAQPSSSLARALYLAKSKADNARVVLVSPAPPALFTSDPVSAWGPAELPVGVVPSGFQSGEGTGLNSQTGARNQVQLITVQGRPAIP